MAKMLVGLFGPVGAGKSTIARMMSRYGFRTLPFAGPMKNMLGGLGLSYAQLYGDEKDFPCDLLGGKTPRYAMQTLGTEWGRKCIGDSLWVEAWKMQSLGYGGSIVADDVRFPNEERAIRAAGGVLVCVTRSGAPQPANAALHESECQVLNADYDLRNDGTERDLAGKVRGMVDALPSRL